MVDKERIRARPVQAKAARTARADWQQQARNRRQSRSLKRDIRSPSISALGGFGTKVALRAFYLLWHIDLVWRSALPMAGSTMRPPNARLTNEPCGLKRAVLLTARSFGLCRR
jgi:hypothetical protein